MHTVDDTEKRSRISLIAALGENRVIGKEGTLPWHLPEDLKRFKQLTIGHPVIMGRKTWESIPEKFRPLPGRTNFVITRDPDYEAPGVLLSFTLEEAIAAAAFMPGSEEIFIIGGGQIYAAALPFADRLYLTVIKGAVDGDVFFPEYTEFAHEISREHGEQGDIQFDWVALEKK
ncbi:MAG: diacylglycerol kinase [Parcubacteria group bacterium]|nr:diacylglycerol kinase [Parcubacteria group bacterium]